MSQDAYVSTVEAAAILGVKRPTIYTYVSRGILRSVRRPGTTSSWFHRSDVEAFARRRSVPGREQRRGRLTETAISNVDGSSYYYRGRDPADLAAEYSFEQVAEFLWTGEIPSVAQWASGPIQSRLFSQDSASANEAPPMDVLRVAVATLAATDPLRLGNRPEALVATGRHLISSLVDSLPLVGEAPTELSVAARLWARLTATPSTRDGVEALDRLLTIIADHGVSPSALAARLVASYEADLYGAVQAGLSIVSGARRGGLSSSSEVLLEEISRVGDVEAVLGDLYRTKGVPFLAHPRYTRADPRTAQIVDLVASVLPDHEVIAVFGEISRIADARSLPAAPVELALAAFARAFEFTRGGSETVFAIGRSAGWVAHAIEAYAQPSPLSPLFSYVGVSPEHEPDLSRVD